MITARARAEADYYLGFTLSLDATEANYEEWFLHDSRGVPYADGSARYSQNPIQLAKRFYGIYIDGERKMYEEQGMFSLLHLFRSRYPLRFLDECIGLGRIQGDLYDSYFHTGLEGFTWPGAYALLAVGAPLLLLIGAFGGGDRARVGSHLHYLLVGQA